MQCKVCPTCQSKSDSNEIICRRCLTPIESVTIVDCDETEKRPTLILSFNGESVKLHDGDYIGREFKGADLFKTALTVSRKHAQVFYREDSWYIKDLESTNGIYLNEKRIEALKEYPLRNHDEVSFSKTVHCKVEI